MSLKVDCKIKQPAHKLPEGGAIASGTAAEFNTGDWRSERPVWNKDKCIHCLICWISCPDSSVIVAPDEKKTTVMTGFDYGHCKGCGICAKECPVKDKAITMEEEKK